MRMRKDIILCYDEKSKEILYKTDENVDNNLSEILNICREELFSFYMDSNSEKFIANITVRPDSFGEKPNLLKEVFDIYDTGIQFNRLTIDTVIDKNFADKTTVVEIMFEATLEDINYMIQKHMSLRKYISNVELDLCIYY